MTAAEIIKAIKNLTEDEINELIKKLGPLFDSKKEDI